MSITKAKPRAKPEAVGLKPPVVHPADHINLWRMQELRKELAEMRVKEKEYERIKDSFKTRYLAGELTFNAPAYGNNPAVSLTFNPEGRSGYTVEPMTVYKASLQVVVAVPSAD